MNALQISPAWKIYYDHPTSAKLGAINAMMPAGKVVGSFASAPFSNRLGRKKALVFGFVLAILGAAIQTGAVNYPLLLVSRLILGLGAGFMSQPSPILLAELAYPTHRGKITALYNTFFVRQPFMVVEGQHKLTFEIVSRSYRSSLGILRYS